LAKALDLLAEHPRSGRRVPYRRLADLRRLTVRGVEYHLYYTARPVDGAVVIHALWSALRGRRPPIGSLER